MTGFVIFAGLIVAVIVVTGLVQIITSKTVDVAGETLGRALQGPRAQGFIALERSSARVLEELDTSGTWNAASGCLTTEQGRAVYLRAGWDDGNRGFECRWESDHTDASDASDVMADVLRTVRSADPAAAIVR